MKEIGYKMEELIPLVEELAEKYTGKESTSISYEKAQELMEAVVFCIQEACVAENSLQSMTPPGVREVYESGYQLVFEKTCAANALYNECILGFEDYGNQALSDTMRKGMPVFFRRYDARFRPQDAILTLDYPLLKPFGDHEGIDRIYEYLQCIFLEQTFLGKLPKDYVVHVLEAYDSGYRSLFVNLSGIVLDNLLGSMAAGKKVSTKPYTEEEILQVSLLAREKSKQELNRLFFDWVDQLAGRFNVGQALETYLQYRIPDFTAALQNAAEHRSLGAVLALGDRHI